MVDIIRFHFAQHRTLRYKYHTKDRTVHSTFFVILEIIPVLRKDHHNNILLYWLLHTKNSTRNTYSSRRYIRM